MDVGYIELADDSPLKKDDNIFVIPRALNDRRCNFGLMQDFYGTFDEGKKYVSISGTQLETMDRPAFKMKHSILDVLYKFETETVIATINPPKAVVKMIKDIKATMDVSENTKIFISQVILDKSPSLGFEGVSFCVGDDFLGVAFDGKYYFTEYPFKKDAILDFKFLDKKYKHGVPLESEKEYKECVKVAVKKSYPLLKQGHESNMYDHQQNYKSYISSLKQQKGPFLAYKKAEKVINQYKKTAPPEIIGILEAGERESKKGYTTMMDLARQANMYSKKYVEMREGIRFYKESHENAGGDWKAVQNLIKKGVIESVTYKTGVGISWIYAPMTYDTKSVGLRFLGRIKTTLLENPHGGYYLKFEQLSYPNDGNQYGTWHFQGRENGASLCMGSFRKIFDGVIYGAKISNLILVCKDYIQSADLNSKHSHPNWDHMDLENPKVIDDSFQVWKASQEKK
jgi:hypothetical protein